MSSTATGAVRRFELDTAADVHGDRRVRELQILGGLNALEAAVVQRIAEIVQVCRDQGASWSEIAATLHVSKQAAHERFTGRMMTPGFAPQLGIDEADQPGHRGSAPPGAGR